jgi:hypothetical protein
MDNVPKIITTHISDISNNVYFTKNKKVALYKPTNLFMTYLAMLSVCQTI